MELFPTVLMKARMGMVRRGRVMRVRRVRRREWCLMQEVRMGADL
jgi:hypothetical protein